MNNERLPTVSICVVFRNAERKLPKLLESLNLITNCTQKIEFIFIDNDSHDKSIQIASEATKNLKNVTIVKRKSNHMALARNQGLRLSKCDWVYFIDSDCALLPGAFERLCHEVVISGNKYVSIGGSQEFKGNGNFSEILEDFRNSWLGHFGSAQMKKGSKITEVNHLSTSHVLYNRTEIIKLGGFNNKLKKSAEDLELSLRISQKKMKMLFIPESKISHAVAESIDEWVRKAFRNAIWQTRLIGYNSSIAKTIRFWASPIILVSIILVISNFTEIILPLGIGYGAILLKIVWKPSRQNKKKLFGLYILTHLIYFIGGLIGIILAIKDFALSNNEPISTTNW